MSLKPPVSPNTILDFRHVYDEGTSLGAQDGINFTGAGVTVTENAANDRLDVTIPGGGGSGTTSQVNVLDYGAVADGKRATDGAITSGTSLLSCPSAAFTSADIGKLVHIERAGSPLTPPANLTATAVVGSGLFAAGTYYYKIAAFTSDETLPSTEASVVVALNGQVDLVWDEVVGAEGYRLYRATVSNGQNVGSTLVASLGKVVTYRDSGRACFGGHTAATDLSYRDLVTTITAVNAGVATLAASATHTVSPGIVNWGTDNSGPIQRAIDYANTHFTDPVDGTPSREEGSSGDTVVIPAGGYATVAGSYQARSYMCGSTIDMTNMRSVQVVGLGRPMLTFTPETTSLFDILSASSITLDGLTMKPLNRWYRDDLVTLDNGVYTVFTTLSAAITSAGATTITITDPLPRRFLNPDNGQAAIFVSWEYGRPHSNLSGAHTLPVATITVPSTAGFAPTGTGASQRPPLNIGGQQVFYTGKTGTTFTGCTGGSGTFRDGTPVDQDTPFVADGYEGMFISGVSADGKTLTVLRAKLGTAATTHLIGAKVAKHAGQTDVGGCSVRNCVFLTAENSSNGYQPSINSCLRINRSIYCDVTNSQFVNFSGNKPLAGEMQGLVVIGNNSLSYRYGQASAYSNITTIERSLFKGGCDAQILVASGDCETLTIARNTFEDASGGMAGAIKGVLGNIVYGCVIRENWFGDVGSSGGSWIGEHLRGIGLNSNGKAGVIRDNTFFTCSGGDTLGGYIAVLHDAWLIEGNMLDNPSSYFFAAGTGSANNPTIYLGPGNSFLIDKPLVGPSSPGGLVITGGNRSLPTGYTEQTQGQLRIYGKPQTDVSGTTYSTSGVDIGSTLRCTNAGATAVTIAADASIKIGGDIDIVQYGAGIVTLTAGGGVTLRSDGGKLRTAGQYAVARLRLIATNEYVASGDLQV